MPDIKAPHQAPYIKTIKQLNEETLQIALTEESQVCGLALQTSVRLQTTSSGCGGCYALGVLNEGDRGDEKVVTTRTSSFLNLPIRPRESPKMRFMSMWMCR